MIALFAFFLGFTLHAAKGQGNLVHFSEGNLTSIVKGVLLIGDVQKDTLTGHVTALIPDGESNRVYIGDMKNGKSEGEGTLLINGVIISGQFKNGNPDGYGTIIFQNKNLYVGQIKNYQAHGRGYLVENCGTIQYGDWQTGNLVRETATLYEEEQWKNM